jgi:hypothetical protein
MCRGHYYINCKRRYELHLVAGNSPLLYDLCCACR